MKTYNLADQAWVPVLDKKNAFKKVSLLELFEQAHEIKQICCDTPLQEIALNRFAQALYLDMLDPEGYTQWVGLLNAPSFDEAKIQAYFEEYHNCFELIDDPGFYQHPEVLSNSPSSVSRLFEQRAGGNNPAIFDHSLDDYCEPIDADKAAIGLITTQAITLGGGVSEPFYFSEAPYVRGALFWVEGSSLKQSLLLNTPPDHKARIPTLNNPQFAEFAKPAWRREVPVQSEKRSPVSYLDYLTWQSRRIKLIWSSKDTALPQVEKIWISQGDKEDSNVRDPLMAERRSKSSGIYPFKITTGKQAWRDYHILSATNSEDKRLGVAKPVKWVLYNDDILDQNKIFASMYGLDNKQGTMLSWRKERIPFFKPLLEKSGAQEYLEESTQLAEEQYSQLQFAARAAAAQLLYPQEGDSGYKGLGKEGKRQVRAYVDHLQLDQSYWSNLETPFYTAVEQLADLFLGEQNEEAIDHARWEWANTLYSSAKDLFRAKFEQAGIGGKELKAAAKGRAVLRPTSLWYDFNPNTLAKE